MPSSEFVLLGQRDEEHDSEMNEEHQQPPPQHLPTGLAPRYHKFWVDGQALPPFPLLQLISSSLLLPVQPHGDHDHHVQLWNDLWSQLQGLHRYSKYYDGFFQGVVGGSFGAVLALGWSNSSTSDSILTLSIFAGLVAVTYLCFAHLKQRLQTSRDDLCRHHEATWLLTHYGMAVECAYEHSASSPHYLYLYLIPIAGPPGAPDVRHGGSTLNSEGDMAIHTQHSTSSPQPSWLVQRNGYIRIKAFCTRPWYGLWTPVRLNQLLTLSELSRLLPPATVLDAQGTVPTVTVNDMTTGSGIRAAVWREYWTEQCHGHWSQRLRQYRMWIATAWAFGIWLIVAKFYLKWNIFVSVAIFILLVLSVLLPPKRHGQHDFERQQAQEQALSRAGFHCETRAMYEYSLLGAWYSTEYVYVFPPCLHC
jgi:hypothetical protein